MAALGVPGEIILNVCSGRATRLREVVECIVNAIAPDQATELLAALREAPGRPDDIPWIVGDPTKITELLQAEPQRVPLIQTVRDAV